MKKRHAFLAIAFCAMLAITGCGDEGEGDGGSGGAAGSGGGGSASFCDTLCNNCGEAEAECVSQCNQGIGDPGGVDLASCPAELATLGACVEANGCQSAIAQCSSQLQEWVLCVAGVGIPF
jgi:hypothetical protein